MSRYTARSTGGLRRTTESRRNQSGHLLRFVLVAAALVLLAVPLLNALRQHAEASEDKSATHASAAAKTANAHPVSQADVTAMAGKINTIIADNPDVDISVSITDLTNGQTYSYGPGDVFEAASTAKLITATDFLHHVEQGDAAMDDRINSDTASDQLQALIVNSDNDAWNAFNTSLGHDDLASYADLIGIDDYNVTENTLSSGDIALLLTKLYQGKLLNHTDTQLLLGYMAQANEADYIPAAVRSAGLSDGDVKVYHKAGLLEDRIHDAAIIDDGSHPYVVVIFTNGHGTYDLDARAQALRDITTATIDTFIR